MPDISLESSTFDVKSALALLTAADTQVAAFYAKRKLDGYTATGEAWEKLAALSLTVKAAITLLTNPVSDDNGERI